jgi:hypothetical protein
VKKDKNAAPVTGHGCGKPGAPAEGMLCRNCGGNAYAPKTVTDSGVALYGRWIPARVEGLAGVKHTLNLNTEEGKAALVAAGSPGDYAIPEGDRLRMTVCDVAVFWDQETDEDTGEVREFVRTCFYDRAGRTFRTSSPHAPHFFARCVDVYGMERIRAGLPITVCERRSKREKRMYHDFRVDLPAVHSPGQAPADEEERE